MNQGKYIFNQVKDFFPQIVPGSGKNNKKIKEYYFLIIGQFINLHGIEYPKKKKSEKKKNCYRF